MENLLKSLSAFKAKIVKKIEKIKTKQQNESSNINK